MLWLNAPTPAFTSGRQPEGRVFHSPSRTSTALEEIELFASRKEFRSRGPVFEYGFDDLRSGTSEKFARHRMAFASRSGLLQLVCCDSSYRVESPPNALAPVGEPEIEIAVAPGAHGVGFQLNPINSPRGKRAKYLVTVFLTGEGSREFSIVPGLPGTFVGVYTTARLHSVWITASATEPEDAQAFAIDDMVLIRD